VLLARHAIGPWRAGRMAGPAKRSRSHARRAPLCPQKSGGVSEVPLVLFVWWSHGVHLPSWIFRISGTDLILFGPQDNGPFAQGLGKNDRGDADAFGRALAHREMPLAAPSAGF